MNLTQTQKIALLKHARVTLIQNLSRDDARASNIPGELNEVANIHTGCFVTLTQNGELRGCIGQIESTQPLPVLVGEMAIAAATHDPRFPKVKGSELTRLNIEISVLTIPEPVTDVGKIEIGRHGLIIEDGWHRGLLLPQVPVEWSWNREEFLINLCYKAGLAGNAWEKTGVKLYWFEAIVFSESDFNSNA